MKLLIFWDVYGRVWRAWLKKELPGLIEKYKPDFVVANVDNISSWRWAIEKHVLELASYWVDIMTSWDHIFDNYIKIKDYLAKSDSKLVRIANFYDDKSLEWTWYKIFEKNGKKLLIIHLQWEIFMAHRVFNPFIKAKEILEIYKNENIDAIVIDFHKETTAEWYGLLNALDWEVSFIFWSHTHVQTNDDIIFPKWTWFINDAWMNWPLYSVIWADFQSVKDRFMTWIWKWKIEQCTDSNYQVCWAYVEIWDDKKCEKIEKIRILWK
jgi:metallophosphoesterase (TIGR00282 family)